MRAKLLLCQIMVFNIAQYELGIYLQFDFFVHSFSPKIVSFAEHRVRNALTSEHICATIKPWLISRANVACHEAFRTHAGTVCAIEKVFAASDGFSPFATFENTFRGFI